MGLSVMHRKDGTELNKRVATINNALVQIKAYQTKMYRSLYDVIFLNNNRIDSITKSVRVVTNIVNNLTYAAKELIKIYKNAFIVTGKSSRYAQAANEWLVQTGYNYA